MYNKKIYIITKLKTKEDIGLNNTFLYVIAEMVRHIKITDILDILIVAYAIYKTYEIIKQTRAEQLIKGILMLIVALFLSEIMHLYVVNWILKNTMTVGILAILIVFQPEFRRILENLGRNNLFSRNSSGENTKQYFSMEESVKACENLSSHRIGAIIVFEKMTGLNEIIQTGTMLNADVSRGLLINIFIPNTPLHDGAVIIRNDKIIAASCFLPLTENKDLSKELGTRHRAAIGITERSDAIVLVVSEETGVVSIAKDGRIYRDLKHDILMKMLENHLFSRPKLKKDPEKKGKGAQNE